MARSPYRAGPVAAAAAAVLLALGGCGGDGDGDGGDSQAALPAPAQGKATVGGKLTRDGRALGGQDLELTMGSTARRKTKTRADGTYVFTGVAPGTYTLVVRAETDSGATADLEARGGRLRTCKAPGYGPQDAGGLTVGPATITSQGGTRYKTFQTLEGERFSPKAGDRVERDVALTCE